MIDSGVHRHSCGWYRVYERTGREYLHPVWGTVTPERGALLDYLSHSCVLYHDALEKAQRSVGKYNDVRDRDLDTARRNLAATKNRSSGGVESERILQVRGTDELPHQETDPTDGEGRPGVLVSAGGTSDTGGDTDHKGSEVQS
jgi:hypothetical protein